MDKTEFDLPNVILDLRRTLKKAQEEGEKEALKFLIEEIEVEFHVVTREETGGQGGVKFWVLNAEAAHKVADEAVHRIRLKLKPKVDGAPVTIRSEDRMPKP